MDKYKISKIKAVFISRMTEARYFESIRADILLHLKYSIWTGIGILWLYSLLDLVLLSKNQTLNFFLVKIIPTLSSLVLLIFLKRIINYEKFFFFIFLNLILFILAATYIFINDPAMPLEMAITQFIFILGLSLIIPNSFIYSMTLSLLSSGIFCFIDFFNFETTASSRIIIVSSFLILNFFIFYTLRRTHVESRLKFRELVKEQKYIRVLNKEILKRIELEKKLTELACMDSLTGACNRRFFIDISEHEKRKSHRNGNPLSLILLDVDNFKVINDTYGHSVGDKALKKLLKICRQTLREGDVIGRIGGEEFAVLCPGSSKDQALEIAKRLCKNIKEQTSKLNYHFTVSIGVSEVKPEHRSIERALHLADLALYEAKREGKNQVKVA